MTEQSRNLFLKITVLQKNIFFWGYLLPEKCMNQKKPGEY